MRRATVYNSIHRVLPPSVALPLAPSLPEGGNETSLNPFMGSKYPMHGWQANLKRTGAQPVVLGLRPKMKYPPLCGGMFIAFPLGKVSTDRLTDEVSREAALYLLQRKKV